MQTWVRCQAVWLAALVLAGCEASKSANPLSPTVAGPIPGVNITAPKLLEPGNNWELKPDRQPVNLLIENASSNGQRPLSYYVELASDVTFQQVIFTRGDIPPGENGRTTYRLPDPLATGRTYYWRARAQDGANTGPFSAAAAFTLLQPIVIQAPVPLDPVNGETVNAVRPGFRFRNAPVSGPAGPITYTVEVSRNDSFTAMAAVMSGGQQGGETEIFANVDLPASTTFFWRVRGGDPETQGPWSATARFVTGAPAPAPPPPPPGGGGGGGGGSCASRDGDYIVNCIAAKYAWYRRAGVSSAERRSNMEFLRDRIIEAGLCGGLDLGWNLKRGGPEISIDFLAERSGGAVIGHDIAIDYDNTSRELQLYWGGGTHPYYKRYDRSFSCN